MVRLVGPFFVFVSALLYGSYGVWAVLLGDYFGKFFQAYVRSALILAIIVALCVGTKRWVRMEWSDAKYFKWPLVFLPFSQVPIYYAFQHASIGVTTLLFFGTYAVVAYLVAHVLLGEKIGAVKVASLVLALVGLHLTFAGSLGIFSLLALCMAIVGGVASGGGMSALKLVPQKFSTLQVLVITWGLSVVIHIPMSLFAGEAQRIPALDLHWLVLMGFAIAGFAASWFAIEGLRRMDASLAGLVSLSQVVFAVLFGHLFFSEELRPLSILGGAIIMISAALPHVVAIAQRRGWVSDRLLRGET